MIYFPIHLYVALFEGKYSIPVGLPVVLVVKNLLPKAGDLRDVSSTPGSGRSPGGGHSNPVLYSCLGNPMDRGAWRATVHELQRVRHNLVIEYAGCMQYIRRNRVTSVVGVERNCVSYSDTAMYLKLVLS